MRGILVTLALLFGLIAPAVAQGVSPNQMFGCNQSQKYDASTNGSTKLVTGVANKQVYICGWNILSGGTANVKFVYGTQVTNPCDTGTTNITPAWQLTAQIGEVDHLPVYTGILPAPALNDVCINVSAGTAVQAVLYYTQF